MTSTQLKVLAQNLSKKGPLTYAQMEAIVKAVEEQEKKEMEAGPFITRTKDGPTITF